jgi:hypothetical protein
MYQTRTRPRTETEIMTERKPRKAPVRRKPEEKEALAKAIIDGMAIEGLSCFKSCEAVGVPIGTFIGWTVENEKLAESYARARETLIERMAAETLAIADAPVGSTEHGTTDSGAVQKQRLQVDTRKWMLSKLAPKKYGDKVTLAGDGENPLKVQTVRRVVIDDDTHD